MGEDFRTKSGLKPDDNGVPFSISTNQVEKYLQQRVDVVTKSANIDSVEIKIYTTEPGKDFCPLVVVLPTTVLQNQNQSSEDEEPSIFTPNKSSKKIRLRPELYHLFKLYIYNENDEKAFFSNDWRNRTGVRSDASAALKQIRVPTLTKSDGTEIVMFLLDPLKVFHDMLKIKDDNRPYRISIKTLKKIKTGEFIYGIERSLANTKGNKKYKDVLINEINKKLRGGRNY
jgi:hypothetical protein